MKRVTGWTIGLLMGLCALAAPGAKAQGARPAVKPAHLAVYRWGAPKGPGQVTEFTKWLGRTDVWGEDFEPSEYWDSVEGGGWQLGPWRDWKAAQPGRKLLLSVTLLPGGWDRSGPTTNKDPGKVSYEEAAKGAYDKHFTELAKNLVSYGLGDTILRLGWEMNGGWYTWRASGNEKEFIAYWQHIVKAMRAVPGTKDLKFCFNPSNGWLQFPADQAYPGDDYVDYIGLDVYDQSWAPDTYPIPKDATPADALKRQMKAWNDVAYNGSFGLVFWRDFAAKHKKLFSIPEWGVCTRSDGHGGGDSPYFIEQMAKFIADPANNVAFHCYFDVGAPDGDHMLSTGEDGKHVTAFPESAKLFKKLYGGKTVIKTSKEN